MRYKKTCSIMQKNAWKTCLRMVYLIQLIISKVEKAETYLAAFHANVCIFSFSRYCYHVNTWYRSVLNVIFFESMLIFFTQGRVAEVVWREITWTDHWVFGCCPVLLCGIDKGNPLSPSFHGFWSWIVEKWNRLNRTTFSLIFCVITPMCNTRLYHFFA